MKTSFRKLQAAVSANDADAAEAEYRTTCSRIDKAVSTGALHRNTGARKKARAARLRSSL